MNILDRIIEYKKKEVSRRKMNRPVSELQKSKLFPMKTLSLKKFLLDECKTGIIAEFKRRSPSKGIINDTADVAQVTRAYADHGASALSVLTDEEFFGGSDDDLMKARLNQLPILRKDFIIDEYQVVEAKAIGADVILLIAACLTPARVRELAALAKSLELEVLLELHEASEMGHICDEAEIIGINNRDLKTFVVDMERSLRMAESIPTGKIKVAESGIRIPADIQLFRKNGYRGFLVGEQFMKEPDPGQAFANFVLHLQAGKEINESKAGNINP